MRCLEGPFYAKGRAGSIAPHADDGVEAPTFDTRCAARVALCFSDSKAVQQRERRPSALAAAFREYSLKKSGGIGSLTQGKFDKSEYKVLRGLEMDKVLVQHAHRKLATGDQRH